MTQKHVVISALVLAICLFFTNTVFAQNKSGKIAGKVIDSQTKQPLARASITVLNSKDSSAITGGYADKNGAFSIDVAEGSYYLRFNYVGYATQFKGNINITPSNTAANVGTIGLKELAIQTREVSVTAEREAVQVMADRRIFNVEQDISNVGGTATDVLANIPSVTVEQDGSVNLRGSSDVKILIDGRPSNMSSSEILEQIPASMISSVELITNPGARYEAEGTAGMINIVTTKQTNKGVNAMVNLNAGIDDNSDMRANASVSANYNVGKWNINASINGRTGNNSGMQTGNRTTWDSTGATSTLRENSDNTSKNRFISGKIGLDYNLTKNDVLTYSFRANDASRKTNVTGNFGIYDGSGNTSSAYRRIEDNNAPMFNTENVLSYKHSFEQKGHELFFDAYYTTFTRDPHKDYEQIDTVIGTDNEIYLYEQNDNNVSSNMFTFQTDYVHPFSKETKIEVGGKANIRANTNKTVYENMENDTWILDPNKSDEFDFEEDVYALYGTFTDKIGKFGYQLGVRSETTINAFNSKTVYEKNFNKDYTGFFPSVYFTYDLNEHHIFNINAARRLKRPNYWELNPFIDYENPLILSSGNPKLDPEYLYNAEFGYLLNYNSTTATMNAFYRYTDNMIMRYTSIYNGDTSITVPMNIASGQNMGLEIILMQKLTKWWKMDGNFTFYNSTIDATNIGGISKNSNIWTTRINSNFNFNKTFELQLSANYRSNELTAQGENKSQWSANMSMKYNLLSNNASISFNIRDLFDSRKRSRYTQQPGVFYDESESKWGARQYTLGFTYKFNNYKQKRERPRDDSGMYDDTAE